MLTTAASPSFASFVAAPFVTDFRELTDVFAAVAPYRQLGGRMATPDGPHEFSPTITTSDFFDTLGVETALGRVYTARGAAPDTGDVIVLRHGYWLEAFGGAPILGQPVRVNDQTKTVIGIIPDEQALPNWADSWEPADQSVLVGGRFQPFGSAIARLRPGVSIEQARQRLDTLAQSAQHRDRAGALIGGQLTPLRDSLIGARQSSLALLIGAVLAFLLLACANLAALLGTRAAVRDEVVDRKQFQNRGEQRRRSVPVGANDALSAGIRRKIPVGEDELISVSHFRQEVQQFGGDERRNGFEHDGSLLNGLPRGDASLELIPADSSGFRQPKTGV